jgi:DUF4097 and DUF4098 domain-containing protein YvlB
MRLPCTFALLMVTVAAGLRAQPMNTRSDTIERSFSVMPGGRLVIEADRGSITTEGTEANEVRVSVSRRVVRGSDERAAELLRRHQVRFSEKNNTVRVECELKDRPRFNGRGPQLQVQIRVALPANFNLDAKTAGGSIQVTRLKGDVRVQTSGGSLALEDVSGKVRGQTSGGSIKGTQLGGSVDLSTSGGSIEIAGITGEGLNLNTSGGSIDLSGIEAPATARTSGGSISVETSASPLELISSGGGVTATFTAPPRESVSIKTSAGTITVSLPADAAFNLDAATSAGGIRSEFPVSASRSGNGNSLRGPANGGGPEVLLRTSAGSIRLKKV